MSRYEEIMNSLNQKAVETRIPIDAKIELTHRCNLNCIHCYVNQSVNAQHMELTFSEWANILSDLKKAGALHLLITGGEVCVRKDFIDIYVLAKKLGFIVTVYTNATLLTNEHISVFKEYPPYVVEVSLYGNTPETYKSVTGVENSYYRCIKGIELLVTNGIRVKLKTMLLKNNISELEDMKKYAKDINVPFNFDGVIAPRIDGDLSPLKQRLLPEEIVAQDIIDINRKNELAGIYNSQKDKGCAAGLSSFLIEPNGDLSICVLCREPRISLRKYSFDEAWEMLGVYRNRILSYPDECMECENRKLCWCPGFVDKSHSVNDTFMCKLAKERVRQIING